jgi:N-methyl-L-proline demethylase
VTREGNKLVAHLFNDYSRRAEERRTEQIVIEHGTLPNDEVYFALKPLSRNLGEIDHAALIANRPQELLHNPEARFALYRIGDAVSSRNIHAAVYDGLRLAKDF